MLNRSSLHTVLPALLSALIVSPAALGHIYQWKLVDPADPSQGRWSSSTLCPHGAGLDLLPGLNAHNRNLTQAWLSGYDLTDADFDSATLTNADLTQANLTDADFGGATLTNAYLTQANLTEADFRSATLTNADLTQANLTDAYFWYATLTDADFTDATIAGANFGNATSRGFTRAQFESTANYASGDLARVGLGQNDLSSWNFANKNLTKAQFLYATLTNADFTGATIAMANFRNTTSNGFTQAQFESTANYASGDLAGVGLGQNDLSSWNFANMDLTNASFEHATLTDADFTGATIAGAGFEKSSYGGGTGVTRAQFESTASYASGDLVGVGLNGNDLSSLNFAGKNLTDANFDSATLTGTDFTGATIAGAYFDNTTSSGFTRAQFESTASYVSGDLARVWLGWNDLSSWNFVGKNLTDAGFLGATLTNADLTGANLTDANFWYATLTDADLTGADARGAREMLYGEAASLDNFVKPHGRVDGLNVAAGEQFRVWDYDGRYGSLLGITVLDEFVIDDAGLLIVGLEDGDWGSTIAFGAGISVHFDGTLEVELRNGFMPIVGDQWQLFDFAGVTPTGGFDAFVLPTLAGGMQWDTANLMNSGVLAVAAPEPTSLLIMAGTLAATTIRRRR